MRLLEELRERRVLQTAAVYFAVAWGATEVLSFLVERIPVFPAWTSAAIAILFVLGFPVVVFLAWMFDVGASGVRRADPASGLGKGVIALSVVALLVTTGALSYLLLPKIEAEQGIISVADIGTVAVLPFENLTGDPSLGYLGVGLAEDIRQRLALQTDLQIIGRVSIAGFTGAGTDLAAVRNLLDAGLALEGSVQRAAGRLMVNVSLLDTASGRQVWSNTFREEDTGWGPLRQRIVMSLAEQLDLTVRVRSDEAAISDEALAAYLRGLAELAHPEVADGWFDDAIRMAPEFADAWARKALLRVDMIWRGESRDQAWAEAEPLFTRARELEATNLLADIAEAQLLWLSKLDIGASYAVSQRVAERAPNHPLVLGASAIALRYMPGRQDESVNYGRRYLAQDPLSPDAHVIYGTSLSFNGNHGDAIAQFERALELDPAYMLTYEYMGNVQFYMVSPADALATMTRKAEAEGWARAETDRCLVYMAGDLLPFDRAESLLRGALARGVGRTAGHGYCFSPIETLLFRLVQDNRFDEARQLLEEPVDESIWTWPGSEALVRMPLAERDGAKQLAWLMNTIGEEALNALSAPEPQIDSINFWVAQNLARSLINSGRIEEARHITAHAVPIALERTGPKGVPTISWATVDFLAMSGDVDAAIAYAEQIGPEGFQMFGRWLLEKYNPIPELEQQPRWIALKHRCRERWETEVEKFDRLVASGEIRLP